MKGIGGNLKAIIQVGTVTINDIGEQEQVWVDTQTIRGWLDLSSGDSNYTSFNAKMQESTHLFISDFVKLDSTIHPETSRMIINGKRYDILLIDNPMELCSQLEFYLKYTGGQ